MRYALLLLPVALQAQSLPEVCTAIRTVEVGYWAEYEMTGDGEDQTLMRNQMVGTERRSDSTFWWHETVATSAEGAMVIRTLVPGYPFDPSEVRELIMQMAEEDAVRMPDEMLSAMRASGATQGPLATSIESCTGATVIGWETVETPAGSVRALRVIPMEDPSVALWLSPDVPFGLVKVEGDGFRMVLTGHGRDARSAITGGVRDM